MKITKEAALEHCATEAAHHEAGKHHHQGKAEQHVGHAKLHKAAAERYDVSDPEHSQYHRDKAALHEASAADHQRMAVSHGDTQAHYESLRERLTASPDSHVDLGADIIDEHESSTRHMHDAAGTGDSLLKRFTGRAAA